MDVESLSEIYSLIVTIDQLEKAYIRDLVAAQEYTQACQRLLGQYATLLRSSELEQQFGDIDSFVIKYRVQAPNGVTRIKVGVPATVEIAQPQQHQQHTGHQQPSMGPQHSNINPQAVAEVTGNFITAMDGLKLNFRAKDQLHPLFSELVTSLNKVTKDDFEGRGKLVQWLIVLNKLKINDELDDEQVRQCLFDLEAAYKNFYTILASKVVFVSSIIGAAITIPAVHWMQADQRETIRQGPVKDFARRNRKLTAEQELRVNEYEEQKMLREHFSADQQVTNVEDIKNAKSV